MMLDYLIILHLRPERTQWEGGSHAEHFSKRYQSTTRRIREEKEWNGKAVLCFSQGVHSHGCKRSCRCCLRLQRRKQPTGRYQRFRRDYTRRFNDVLCCRAADRVQSFDAWNGLRIDARAALTGQSRYFAESPSLPESRKTAYCQSGPKRQGTGRDSNICPA